MKKKLFYLLVAWFLPMWICAGPVDPSRALQEAHEFVQKSPAARKAPQKGTSTQPANIVYTHKMPQSDRAAFYIVNVDDAFVLVSADDVAYQVLGYSFDKSFPIAADGTVYLPPHVKGFFDDLARQIEAAADAEPNRTPSDDWTGTRNNAPRRSPSNLPESVDPLLTTTWDQGALYNTLCPEDDGGPNGHVWAGCVATAMAQIINYWSSTPHGRGTHSYDSNYGTLEVNFENSFYDFDNMPDALTNESTQEQIYAVAKLIFDCGVAVNMEYGPGESASFNQEARAGLINFFLFSPDMSFAEKEFFTDNDWNTLLCENLAANHPVIYSGQSGNGGHTFICDGYKADNYYHFNFGWGGFCDGWYLTSAVDVNNSSYNSSQSALVGIVPDNEGNVILGQMKGNSTFTVNEPLEFYNLMGHNVYEGNNYLNFCDNTVTFIPADATKQMVVNVMEFEDQTVNIYNGTDANDLLRTLTGGADNDLSPVVSTANALTMNYKGNMYYAGFKLSVSQESNCRMVSNIVSTVDNTTVHLTWTENGTATQWQIEYGVKGFKLGEGTVYNTNTNSATIDNLEKFTEYDFYIRSVNGNLYSQWNKTTLMVEAPYWQDIVTSQPEGYVLDEITNTVEISTPEALAWWSKTDTYRTVSLTADLDLSAYKWKPTGGGDFNGNGHVIFNGFIIEWTSDVGFFSYYSGTVENLGLENFYVKGKGARTGGLVGQLSGTIRNCYIKNCVVDGGDYTGGLVGESNSGTVINSFVNVNSSGARWASLLIGNSYQSVVKNCYAAGSFRQRAYCYNGGIIAYSDGGAVSNCYSVEMPMGVIGYKGSTVINDTATFVKTDAGLTLLTPVVFDEQPVTNLLMALNNWVDQYNDAAINTWVADQNHVNDGYPVFGSKHVVQCPNVTDVTIQNVKTGDKNEVSVGWTENGGATKWQIRYRRHDIPDASYTYVTTSNNPVTIQNIPLGYVYEFNVRAIGEGERKSGWSDPQYAIVDLPYWTDVVKEQPAGYLEDADGNVTISSTEGLVWLSVITNGLHGQEYSSFAGKTVVLNADVDLAGYRWNPTGQFDGTFDGQGHSILNIYVNDTNSCGLFGMVSLGGIKNVNMVGGSVTNTEGGSGGLIGCAADCKEITNCHSSVDVYGNGGLGSLCGAVINVDIETIISNCSASGTVYGRQSCGGLIGNVNGQVIVRNCFATGDVNLKQGNSNAWYRGGLIGHSFFATILNSYSTGTVYVDPASSSYIGRVIGCPEDSHIHYLYGQDDVNPEMELIGCPCNDISNDALFHHEGNKNNLLSSISVSGKTYSDLVEALNAWVTLQNDAELRTWTLNPETGYPVFGDMFVPSCSNPTDLAVSNATTVDDATIKTELSWNQIGNPKSWEVLYVPAEHNVSEGIVVPVTSNPCVLTDIPVGKPLDFYVRAVNNEADKSYWSSPVTFIPDKLHWTEVITSQPEGYREDSEGNVYISSAEGLAWLSSVVNELNGVSQNSMSHKQIFLMSDIDLSAYRWTSIGNKDWWEQQYGASFNGNNHTISGLYCNELSNYQGLFGVMSGNVYNLVLTQCSVMGEQYVGAIAGYSSGNKIVNCSVNGNVCGIEEVGGLVGRHIFNSIENSCFIGNVASRRDISKVNTIVGYVGGICGVPFNNSIVNCYVVSEISDDGAWSGIITGTGGSPMLVSNCYYKKYETTLSITSDNCNSSNNSAFTGSESMWTLNTPSFINGAFYSDLVDALNAWVDANNTEGKYHHWMADTDNVNGGFPIFAVMGDVTAQGYEGIYDGEAHAISVTAPEGAIVRYGEAADACVLDASPTYTDVGSYIVYYEVTKANYTPVTGSAAIVITKAAGTIGYANATVSKTYGDEPFTNELTLVGDGTVSYASSEPSVATVDAATGLVTITGNGTAIITATVDDGTNYTYAERTATYTLSVGTATMTVTAQGYEGVYDGEAHAISVTAPEGATVRYGEAADACTLDASPAYTDAGSYTVYYEVTKANYTPVTGSAAIVITKAAGTIGYANTTVSKTYGDEPFTNELTLVGDGSVSYASSEPSVAIVDAASGLVTITATGTAIITATVDDGTNYTYAEKTATYTLSVGTATMTVTAQGYEGVYDGEAHAISVTAPEGATVRYGETADACVLDASPAYTDAGSYTVYYEVTKANYTPITGSQTVVITTKAIERIMIVEIAAQVYTGSELTPAATVIDGNIVLTEGIDYAIAYENNVKIGTATITVTGMGNYNGCVQTTFAIVADKTALAATIDAATAYYESICDRFANIAATLHDAIEDAMDIFNDTAATQEDTDAAVTMLSAAIKAAKEAVEQAQTVKAITIQQTDDVWYTVNGRRLSGRPHAKGIYICNGRLVVIK